MSECPKCGGRMEPGFIVDQGRGQVQVASWEPGEPQPAFLTGIKLDRKKQVEITTLRCERCGFLESYAPPPATG